MWKMKVKEILKDCPEWMPGTDYDEAKPVVSVLLPTFRRAKSGLFETAVRSVLNQDFKSLELIIIDDASTDGTADLIRHFMQIDPRVSCIRHKFNVGLPAISEYEGYMKARGEYIAFIFDDNEWERDYIGKTIPFMIRNDAKAAYGKVRSYYTPEEFLELGDAAAAACLSYTNRIANGGVILARETIETVGLYDPHVALTRLCDWNLWKRISQKYEWFATGFLAGAEYGVLQKDSLGNSYNRFDHWTYAEREHFQEREAFLPSNFGGIEIDEVTSDNSAPYIDAVRDAYDFFSNKEWFKEKAADTTMTGNPQTLRILVLLVDSSASVTLSFGRLLKQSKNLVFQIRDTTIPIYDIAQADAVVLVRNFFVLERFQLICNKLNIPCYLYLDDNFIELAKEYKNEPLIQKESDILQGRKARLFDAVLVSTEDLRDYCEKRVLNDNLMVLEPCMSKNLPQGYNRAESQEPVTMAFMGGGFRDESFQNIVIPAILKVAKQRKIRLLYPSRINVEFPKTEKNVELIPIEFSLSLDTALLRYGKYQPQFLLHCGPDIKNNVYKTENGLINAVQLGAVLVSSNVMPYRTTSEQRGCCVCADNTIEDWYITLLDLIEDQDKAQKTYDSARKYCGTRYTGEQGITTLKKLFKTVQPTQYYEIVRRLRGIMFEQIYGKGDIGTIIQRPSRSLTEVPLSFTGGLAKSKSYPITCNVPTFSELGICFSSFGTASGKIRIGIFSPEGNKLRECVLDMNSYVHDNWTYLEFEPIENSDGQVYTIKLDFEYDENSALVGVFENATKRTFSYRLLNKLGIPPKIKNLLFADCR